MTTRLNKTGAVVLLLLAGGLRGWSQTEKGATETRTVQPSPAQAQQPAADSASAQAVEDQTQSSIPHPGVLLDRVVAVVNGQVVLESDVDEERRLEAFQPITDPEQNETEKKLLERLINRELLLQQSKLQPQAPITDEDVQKQIAALRRDIPACKEAHCETEAGWRSFLASRQVTEGELERYWKERLQAMQFIELRFRSGIHITQAQIKDYYQKTMLPEYEKRHVSAPPLDKLADRIQGVLLEQQVSGLLTDWLNSLRAQGTVQIVDTNGASAS